MSRINHSLFANVLILLTFWSIGFASIPGQQQERIRFNHLTADDGLSMSVVHSTLQDSQGFMWIGTEEGLDRFDGYRVISYRHDVRQPGSIASDNVTALAETPDGRLFVGTKNGGLHLFDRSRSEFLNFNLISEPADVPESHEINILYLDSNDRLWVGSSVGIFMIAPGSDTAVQYHIKDKGLNADKRNDVLTIFEDSNSRLFIGTRFHGIHHFDRDRELFVESFSGTDYAGLLRDNAILAIAEDSSGRLWISIREHGLLRYQPENSSLRFYKQNSRVSGNEVPGLRTMYMFLDSRGKFWLATVSGGLVQYHPRTDSFSSYIRNPFDDYSLSDVSAYHISEDLSGQLWIATNNNLSLIDPAFQVFGHEYSIAGDDSTISSNNVFALHKDSTGRLWVGFTENGLSYLDPGERSFRHIRPGDPIGLTTGYIRSIYEDSKGTLWFGSGFSGLYRLDKNSQRMVHYQHDPEDDNSPSNDFIRSIVEDQSGLIWFGTQFGLNRYDRERNTFEQFLHEEGQQTGLPSNNVFVILPSGVSTLWLGTSRGLCRYDTVTRTWETWQHDPEETSSLSNSTVYSLCMDSRGRLWVGTAHGLNRFDWKNNRFFGYTTHDGLPNNVIYAIEEDRSGRLWVSTNKGLASLDPETKTIIAYNKHDGLQDNEFNGNCSFKDLDGTLYFGGIGGYTYFKPSEVEAVSITPPVAFVDIRVFGQALDEHSGIPLLDSITLPYHQNYVAFDYAALDLSASDKIRYRYRLKQFKDRWLDNGDRRSVTYTNLPPGQYELQVQSTDRWGTWQENEAAIAITITPAFWQTIWFQTAVALLFVGLAVLVYRMRMALTESQKRELERNVANKAHRLEEKKRELEAFSDSVSHDLRTPLWQIKEYSDLLISDHKLDRRARELAERIRIISSSSSALIDDLLQFSKFEKEEMQVVPIDLSAIANDVAASLRTQDPDRNVKFDIAEGMTTEGDPRMVRVLLQNLLSNAWKYTSREEFPVIECGRQDSSVKPFYVKDNGVGFDMGQASELFTPFKRLHSSKDFSGTGIGLSLAQRIVHRHGGRIWARSEKNKGATFFFTFATDSIGSTTSTKKSSRK